MDRDTDPDAGIRTLCTVHGVSWLLVEAEGEVEGKVVATVTPVACLATADATDTCFTGIATLGAVTLEVGVCLAAATAPAKQLLRRPPGKRGARGSAAGGDLDAAEAAD